MFGLTRRCRRHHHDPELTEDTYVESLAIWQIAHGTNRMDLTREQTTRFRAFEAARGDTAVAGRLLFERRLVREGRIRG